MERTFSWFCELKEIAPFPVQMNIQDKRVLEKIMLLDYVQFAGKWKEAVWKYLYIPFKNENKTKYL